MMFPEEPKSFLLPMSKERLQWNLVESRRISTAAWYKPTEALNWLSGKKEIPDGVAVWIETLRAIIMAVPTPPFWGDLHDLRDIRHQTLERVERIYTVPPDAQELLRACRKVIAKWWNDLEGEGRRYWTKAARPARLSLAYLEVRPDEEGSPRA
jgi:hypothetical protein